MQVEDAEINVSGAFFSSFLSPVFYALNKPKHWALGTNFLFWRLIEDKRFLIF